MQVYPFTTESRDIYLGFDLERIRKITTLNPSLRGILQGYFAEDSLISQVSIIPGITNVSKIPDKDKQKGDVILTYKNTVITLESKSVETSRVRRDILNDTWQGRVSLKNSDSRTLDVPGIGKIKTTSLQRGQFDILAISTFAVTGEYTYMYIENDYLPSKSQSTPNLLKTSFVINPQTTPCLTENIIEVLDSIVLKKLSVKIEA